MYMNFNKGDMVEFFSHIVIDDGHAFEAGYPRNYETVLDTGIIVSDVFGGNEIDIDGESPNVSVFVYLYQDIMAIIESKIYIN